MNESKSRIVVALDGLLFAKCVELICEIGSRAVMWKIHDLWDREGPQVVEKLLKAGAGRVWVDLKLHDIPETVRLRAKAVAEAGATAVTVHASGGIEMMRAAVDNVPFVFAVTVLTSLSEENAHLVFGQPSKAAVINMARSAKLAGAYGIVCSPKEISIIRSQQELADLKLVTPGIRPQDSQTQDQKRFDTPAAAIQAGGDFQVIGQPITQAADPVAAFTKIEQEIQDALVDKAMAVASGS